MAPKSNNFSLLQFSILLLLTSHISFAFIRMPPTWWRQKQTIRHRLGQLQSRQILPQMASRRSQQIQPRQSSGPISK